MTDDQRPNDDISENKAEETGTAPADVSMDSSDDELRAFEIAEAEDLEEASDDADEDSEASSKPRPAAKLERLQKILAQGGIASRRHAEAMIEQGRVQVNGKVVTTLGTKADAGRDHIRVDGKLLQGSERLRYFVLNKPKGFVTTVKDPEGRPTVMQFFEKMRERLYPVGRLDYMSEGLLLVTNDGELANKLTKAASGVEKTYLVKVSGQPTEAELDILRSGVAIERGKPGSEKVRTSPARIRQVRQGDNPWYEVVLIEGRNRELRKMFEEVGHFVEKIRRVGYGPLVLDQEPGNLRELDLEELDALQKTADGKMRTPKAKDVRRRNAMDAQLPTLPPKPSRPRPSAVGEVRRESRDFPPKNQFGSKRPGRPAGEAGRGPSKGSWATTRRTEAGPGKFGPPKPGARQPGAGQPAATGRPAWKKDDRPERPVGRPAGRGAQDSRGGPDRGAPGIGRPERAGSGGKFGSRPQTWKKRESGDRPAFQRPSREPPPAPESDIPRPPRLQIDAIEPEKYSNDRPTSGRTPYRGSQGGRSGGDRSRPDRGNADRPGVGRSGGKYQSGGSGRTGSGPSGHGRPPRAEGGGLARPFTTSTGKPRPGGARPSSKAGGRSFADGPRGTSRPPAGRSSGQRPSAGPGGKPAWKPKPGSGSGARPGGNSKPGGGSKPGGFSKSGYKGKPSGGGRKPQGSRSGPRPGGKRASGPSHGKKRG